MPVRLDLPGGESVRLVAATQGGAGLPPAPAGPGQGTVGWHPGPGGAWTLAVTLHPTTGAPATGGTAVIIGEDGTRTALTVRSRSTVDATTAASTARTVGEGPRLVLLLPREDGTVLVVVAG